MSGKSGPRVRISSERAVLIENEPIFVSTELASELLGLTASGLRKWAKGGLICAKLGKVVKERGRPLWLVDLDSAARLTWVGSILLACKAKIWDILTASYPDGSVQFIGKEALVAAIACRAGLMVEEAGLQMIEITSSRFCLPVWAIVIAAVQLGNPVPLPVVPDEIRQAAPILFTPRTNR